MTGLSILRMQLLQDADMRQVFALVGDNASTVKAFYKLCRAKYPWILASFCASHQSATLMKTLFSVIPAKRLPRKAKRTIAAAAVAARTSDSDAMMSELESSESGSDDDIDEDVDVDADGDDELAATSRQFEAPSALELPEDDCDVLARLTKRQRKFALFSCSPLSGIASLDTSALLYWPLVGGSPLLSEDGEYMSAPKALDCTSFVVRWVNKSTVTTTSLQNAYKVMRPRVCLHRRHAMRELVH
jgi:hypothetical protein